MPGRGLLGRVRRTVGSLYVLIPLIVVAATALAYYSYRYADQLARAGEQNIVAANEVLADIEISRIEQTLNESEQTLFNSIDLGNLRDPNRLKDLVVLSPTIESVIVLDDTFRIVPSGQYSNMPAVEYEAFRQRFEDEMLPALKLARMQVNEHTHLHQEFGGRYYLLSATRRLVEGRNLYVVLEIDLAYLVSEVFPSYFEGVALSRVYQIVDEHDNIVFGYPFTGVDPRFVVSMRFPTTLRGWTLRMAPREVPAVLAGESPSKPPFDFVLIGLSAFTVFVGLGVLTAAVRTEKQASALKSDFIANVSHELKTPLSLIRMFGEMLATGRTKGPDSAKEYAQIITRESERLSRLIDNVLDFARIERGKAAYNFAIGDLGEVLSRALDVYRYRMEREGMALNVEIEEALPPVRIDESAMTLVVMNLVDNALKYAADGKEISISLAHEDDQVKLAVRDRGPGIPADERERIFDRFYRGRDVRGRPVRGSGIGLSLVKHIAHAHGGSVELDSTPGQGSTFTVSMPIAKVPAEPEPEAEPAVELDHEPGTQNG
jgi:two-component system, OmpR family, phosphate regulon sensor histidine kinase PhoR